MRLKKGSKLYVRVDYKIGEKVLSHQDFQDHLAYVKSIAEERYFIGGGFSNTDGGMCLFEAESLEEAQLIAQNDPIIEKDFYQCEIFEWNLVVVSEARGDDL